MSSTSPKWWRRPTRNAIAAVACGLLLTGCKKPIEPLPEPERVPVHPDLHCPEGTIDTGAAPPVGQEVWCQKQLPSMRYVRHGPSIAWHTNEQRQSTGDYHEGKPHGSWLYWYATSTPEKQGAYTKGLKNGVWTEFHITGDRKSEGEYVEDEEHGPWMYWTEEKVRIEGAFIMGQQDGVWLDYSTEDVAVRERVYRNGRLVSQREL